MPWPHSNADGKAILNHTEDGKKKPQYIPPPIYQDPFEGSPFHGIVPSKSAKHSNLMDMVKFGLITKEQFDKLVKDVGGNFSTKTDPPLIKATADKKDYFATMWASSPGPVPTSSPAMPEPMRFTVYVDNIPGLPNSMKKIGVQHILNPSHDYYEDEVRRMLMDMFGKITEHIINGMKGNTK